MMPDPVFLNIHMYGIMIAIGVLCAFATLFAVAKKKSIDGKFTDFVSYNGFVSLTVLVFDDGCCRSCGFLHC